ncbi:MAG: iron ABC transporter permease [Chloroflexi bacterium]|nr:iron ABC transporter permease [Chloroflexota bacterium]
MTTEVTLPPVPTGWRQRLAAINPWRGIIVGGTIIVIAYLVLVPLLYLGAATFVDDGHLSLDSFRRAFSGPGTVGMFVNSLVFAVGTAIVSLTCATVLAYIVVRTDAPYRSLLAAVAVLPVVVPNVLYIISWILLASPRIGLLNAIPRAITGDPLFDVFSMAGMIWVEGLHNVPLVFLLMAVAFRSMDASLEEAALVAGASHRTMYLRVTLPLLRPALAAAALVVIVKTLGSFEAAAILGSPDGLFVFVSRIFFVMRDFPYDTGAAGALSVALIVIALAGTWLLGRVRGDGSSYQTVTGKAFRAQPIELGRARRWVLLGVAIYFVVTTGLPLFALGFNSLLPFTRAFSLEAIEHFSLANYAALLDMSVVTRSLWNSLLLAVGTATCILVLTVVAAWVILRSRYRWRGMVDHLAFLPINFPGLVIGLAVSFVYLRNPLPFPIYGTLWIMLIAYVTNFLPYGMRYAVSALERIASELEESAEVSGASWWQMIRRVTFPLMVPGLIAGWILVLIVAARELGASILLYSPGNEVLSVLIFQLYEEGQLVVASALGIVLTVLFAAIIAIAYKVGNGVGITR